MKAISSPELLSLWEAGSRLHPPDKALLILKTGLREPNLATFADWPLGKRNCCIFEWYCGAFGPMLEGWLICPTCGEKLEFKVDGRSLFKREKPASDHKLTLHGVSFRLPNSRDLAESVKQSDPVLAARCILESCLLSKDEQRSWSQEEIAEIGQRMATADPMAETRLQFGCPECACEWEENLDIVRFAWAAIEDSAKWLIRQIHVLAQAYGWSEASILSLSASRRSLYLQMVEQ